MRVHNDFSGVHGNIVLESPGCQEQQRELTVSNQIEKIVKSKAFRYVAAIVLSNLLLQAPFVCITGYGAVCNELGWKDCLPEVTYSITSTFFMVNFNVNAFLYAFWIRTIQQSAFDFCRCIRRCHTRP